VPVYEPRRSHVKISWHIKYNGLPVASYKKVLESLFVASYKNLYETHTG